MRWYFTAVCCVECWVILVPPPVQAGPVEDLLVKLDDDAIDVRDKANSDLTKLLCDDAKNAAPVRAAVNGGTLPPEAQIRALRSLTQFVDKQASVKALAMEVGVTVIEDVDELSGFPISRVWMGCDFTTNANSEKVRMLMQSWNEAREAMARGNAELAKQKICDMQMCIDGLTEQQALDLGFVHGTGFGVSDSDKEFLLIKFANGKTMADDLKLAYNDLGLDHTNSLAAQVVTPGPVELGRTLDLSVANILAPGLLEAFIPSEDLALFRPLPSTHIVGPIFSLSADEFLQVAGPIEIGIEFPSMQFPDGPPVDPSLLRIGRLVDTHFDFLPTTALDLDNSKIFATYLAQPGTGDSFGEFFLMQVPEPSSLVLAWIGAVALIAWGTRRRAAN